MVDIMDAIRALAKRDNRKAVLALCRDWAGIFAAILIAEWASQPVVTVVALWVIGAFQHALGDILVHEAAHGNLFATKAHNDRLEVLFALPCLQTMERYRTEHLRHHGQLGKEGGDYLVGDYRAFGLDGAPGTPWTLIVRPLLGYPAVHYLAKLPTFPHRSLMKLGMLWSVAILVAAASGHLSDFVLYWVVPLLWCRYAFFYWSEIADHANTRSGTRSRLNPVLNWFEHNRGYHLAHHRYPSVPWFNLPAVHRLMEPGDPADSSTTPLDTWRQLAHGSLGAS